MIECVNFRKDVYISLNLKRTSDIFISCSRPELLTDNQAYKESKSLFTQYSTDSNNWENLTFDIKT